MLQEHGNNITGTLNFHEINCSMPLHNAQNLFLKVNKYVVDVTGGNSSPSSMPRDCVHRCSKLVSAPVGQFDTIAYLFSNFIVLIST
jgi:hypothetical protein